ncbi:nicotinic acetylcholine receptor subunit type f, partial [Plakobranchus ocellatus]
MYFCMNMIMITLSEMLACMVANMHFRGVRINRVPKCLRVFMIDLMSRLMCVRSIVMEKETSGSVLGDGGVGGGAPPKKRWNAGRVGGDRRAQYPYTDISFAQVRLLDNGVDKRDQGPDYGGDGRGGMDGRGHGFQFPPIGDEFLAHSQANAQVLEEIRSIRELLERVRDKKTRMEEKDKLFREWRMVALVTDRMLFFIYVMMAQFYLKLTLIILVAAAGFVHTSLALSTDSEVVPYQLTYMPARVFKGFTKNVRLRCEEHALVKSKLQAIVSIRIQKRSEQGAWLTLAEQTYQKDYVDVAVDELIAVGWINKTSLEAFLQISWEVASKDTFGVFRCDVSGFEGNMFSLSKLTSEVEILEQKMSGVDAINFLAKLKEDMMVKVLENANDIAEAGEEDDREMPFDILKPEFLSTSELQKWPTGHYGLLQPRSGCPVDLAFYGGDTGYLRFQVDTSRSGTKSNNYTQVHIAAPVWVNTHSKDYISLHFCVVTRVFNSKPWPNGSFCIHQSGEVCPQKFQIIEFNLNTETYANSEVKMGGVLPHIKPGRLCCTSSGSPDEAIDLPTDNPFYLYRYGTFSCQQVRDMDVIPEVIVIEPVHSRGDAVTLDLCYYVKRNGTETA